MSIKRITEDDDLARTQDPVSDNVGRLAEDFPEAIVEGKVDFEVLRQLLGDDIDASDERYGLSWSGKHQALAIALAPSTATLRPVAEGSADWGATENVVIEGDNLEVLKQLQKAYSGRVKLIYIDPPYNTGSDFVYPDDLHDSVRNYLTLTGQVDDTGRNISTNVETSGRFHTAWLNMMYPRLRVARDLLSDDGVIFLSIDDHEVRNILLVLDEVFGEENRIAIICHKSRASVSNDKIISSSHNFILLYARNRSTVHALRSQFGLAPALDGFEHFDEAEGDYFKWVPVDGPGGGAKGNPHYTFEGVTSYWRFSRKRMQELFDAGRVAKVGSGLQQKYFLETARQSRKTDTTWWDEKLFTSTATSRLKELMGGGVFDNPKPTELIQKMLVLWARGRNDIVMDFFAGSGTTGHAVMAQNAADGGNRRYILVQLPEPLDPENKDQKVAAEFCQELGVPLNIAELTKERLRRAGEKVKAENPDFEGDTGFRVYRLDSSNIREWDPDATDLEGTIDQYIDQIKPDRSDDDLQTEVLLKLGIELTTPIEAKEIAGKKVSSIGAGALITCFDKAITADDVEALASGIIEWLDELQTAGDTTVVFRDDAFDGDVAKTNLSEMLVQHGVARENIRSL